jgi:hypothetical protein
MVAALSCPLSVVPVVLAVFAPHPNDVIAALLRWAQVPVLLLLRLLLEVLVTWLPVFWPL